MTEQFTKAVACSNRNLSNFTQPVSKQLLTQNRNIFKRSPWLSTSIIPRQRTMISRRLVPVPITMTCSLSSVSAAGEFGKMTEEAKLIWKQNVSRGDVVVDATCGNGLDTIFLAHLIGAEGKLFCFDVQGQAMQSTRALLQQQLNYSFEQTAENEWRGWSEEQPPIKIFKQSHAKLMDYQEELQGAKLVCFNLGYLPRSTKQITTEARSTIEAVKSAMKIICVSGIISIVVYKGHPEGMEEYVSLVSTLRSLNTSLWAVSELQILNRILSPVLITILKAR